MIHYELPNNSEIFVHRSGRTGRAGKTGSAILIYSQDQTRNVRMIERDVGCKFKEVPVELKTNKKMIWIIRCFLDKFINRLKSGLTSK